MNLQRFYNYIEDGYETHRHLKHLEFPSSEQLTEIERKIISYEGHALFFNHYNDDLRSKWSGEKETIIKYFSDRYKDTKNPHLLAKYSSFLLWFTKNNKFSKQTFDNYLNLIDNHLQAGNNKGGFIVYING